MLYELRYTNYKDFSGVKFPTVIHVHQGDPRLSVAHNSMEITLSNVQPNVTVPAMPVPADVQSATAPPVRAASQKLADGVWLVAGGTHNSLAVEFRDFVTVIEAPLNEERSLAVLAEVGNSSTSLSQRREHPSPLRLTRRLARISPRAQPSSATRRIATSSRTCCSARRRGR